MRRLIIIAVINLCLISLAIVGIIYFSYIKDACNEYIENSIHYAMQQDNDGTKSNITNAKNVWENHEKYMEIFVYHNYIEDIYLNLVQMQSLAQNKSYTELIVLGKRTQSMLEALYKGEIPTLSRIL